MQLETILKRKSIITPMCIERMRTFFTDLSQVRNYVNFYALIISFMGALRQRGVSFELGFGLGMR